MLFALLVPERAAGSLVQLVPPLLLRAGVAEEWDCSEEKYWGGEGEIVPGREIGDVPGIGEWDVPGFGEGFVPGIGGGFVPEIVGGFVPGVGGGFVPERCQCFQVHSFHKVL